MYHVKWLAVLSHVLALVVASFVFPKLQLLSRYLTGSLQNSEHTFLLAWEQGTERTVELAWFEDETSSCL